MPRSNRAPATASRSATPLTRREFLSSLAVLSTAASVPTFLHDAALAMDQPGRRAGEPGVADHRILVVVQLSGGNDGLNTVVPFGEPAYHKARPTIGIAEKDVLAIDRDAGLGLHPEMAPLAKLIEDGRASAVLGAGYPNPNRSHFASMDIWHSGDTRDGRNGGWIGRAMDRFDETGKLKHASGLGAVAVGKNAPLAMEGRRVKPTTVDNPALFRWLGGRLHPTLEKEYRRLLAAREAAVASGEPGDPLSFVTRTAMDAQAASDRVIKAVGTGRQGGIAGAGALGRQLSMIAALIQAETPTRVYYAAMGGFDTHANQTYQHARLLGQFTKGVAGFMDKLKAMGRDRDVLVLAFSEFGRRVAQNASRGTDHGAAGPMFLFGPMVRPGLICRYPSLESLDRGDLKFTQDFRGVYASILDQWLGVPSREVLGGVYPGADVFA